MSFILSSMSRAHRGQPLLLLLVLLISFQHMRILVVQAQQEQQVYGCFDFRNLTCSLPLDAGDVNVNVEETCQTAQDLIEAYYFNSNNDDVDDEFVLTAVTSEQETAFYQAALANVTTVDPFCYNIQNVYHKCWFCAEQVLQEETGCFDFRNLTCDLDWNEGNADVNVAETCATIQSIVLEQRSFDTTLATPTDTELIQQALGDISGQSELCYNIQNAYHKCSWCGLTPPQEKCFDNFHVTCNTPVGAGFDGFEQDIPTICNELEQAIQDATGIPVELVENDGQTRQHEAALGYLNVNDPLCEKARQVYHKCHWCGVQLSDTTRCFDDPTAPDLTCDRPLDEGDENTPVNDNCMVIEGILYRESNYKAVTLVQSQQDALFHQSILNPFLSRNDPRCYAFKQIYHKCWWCAKNVTKNFCQFESCARPQLIDPTVNVQATCQEMEALKSQRFEDGYAYPATIGLCHQAEQAAFACQDLFCDIAYLGADTEPKKKSLVWLSRVSAFLSFGGACYILWDALAHKKNRQAVYHQLLVGMAVFDIITAVAWAFATAPIPDEIHWVYGAAGNMATCKTQAFFVQLGFTSVFYNVSLALYYVLVIVRDWREFNLVKIRPFMHGIPIVVGLALAGAGLPFYDWNEYGCHLLPPSANKEQGELWQVLVFAVGPIALSICFICVAMAVVYFKVRKQAIKAKKWSASNKGIAGGARNALERTVFFQSIFYVLSFTITWPILFALYLGSVDSDTQYSTGEQPFGLTATIAFVAPLQGFNNFLVYIRPKVSQWRREQQKKAEKRKKMANSSTAATAGASTSAVSSRSFLHRLRGPRSSSSITSKFSFLRILGNKTSEDEISTVTKPSALDSRANSLARSQEGSMSKLDSAISSLNSNSSTGPGSQSLVQSDVSQTESTTEADDIRAESLVELILDEDPSVLIARADRDELLEKYNEKQSREGSATSEAVKPAAKLLAATTVPDTIEEGVEEESSQLYAQPSEVAPMQNSGPGDELVNEVDDQNEPRPIGMANPTPNNYFV